MKVVNLFTYFHLSSQNCRGSIYNISKTMKYLGIKLTRNMCKFYKENFKVLLRGMKEDLCTIKDITFFLARFHSESRKLFIVPKSIFKFKAISIRKCQKDFFF